MPIFLQGYELLNTVMPNWLLAHIKRVCTRVGIQMKLDGGLVQKCITLNSIIGFPSLTPERSVIR